MGPTVARARGRARARTGAGTRASTSGRLLDRPMSSIDPGRFARGKTARIHRGTFPTHNLYGDLIFHPQWSPYNYTDTCMDNVRTSHTNLYGDQTDWFSKPTHEKDCYTFRHFQAGAFGSSRASHFALQSCRWDLPKKRKWPPVPAVLPLNML